MGSQSTIFPNETDRQKIWSEILKFGVALLVMIIVMYGMWLLIDSDRKIKDKQVADSIYQMKKDVESLRKENKECNEFTKSILLKEVQESNELQKNISDYLRRHD